MHRHPEHSARYVLVPDDSTRAGAAPIPTAAGPLADPGASVTFTSPFTTGDSYDLPALCFSVAWADLDEDGRPDLAAAELDDDAISLWRNEGAGHFQIGEKLHLGGPAVWVVTGDFDRDGHADLAVALNTDPGEVDVLTGHGDGTFSPPVALGAGVYPDYLAAGDLDGDGWLDLVTADYTGCTISVLANRHGAFAPARSYAVGYGPAAITIADLDGDDAPDLAVTNSGCATLSVLFNLGDGTFTPRLDYLLPGPALGVVAADFDGDGWRDVAVPSDYGNSFEILWNAGSGSFARRDDYTLPSGETALAIATLHLDGGTLPDLALGTRTMGGRLAFLRNRGSRTFTEDVTYRLGPSFAYDDRLTCITFVDLDGDGGTDALAAHDFSSYSSWSQLVVLRRVRGAAFAGMLDYPLDSGGYQAGDLKPVDFQGTGRPGLMLERDGRWLLLSPRPDGTLAPPTDIGPGGAIWPLDLDGDRRTDVVEAQDSALGRRLCGPDGTLGPFVPLPGSAVVCTGDFDGNRRPDLVVSLPDGSYATLVNDGTGSFLPPVAPGIDAHGPIPDLRVVACADFDGDGRDDLVLSDLCESDILNGDSLSIFVSRGDGTFRLLAALDYQFMPLGARVYGPAHALLPADLNGDPFLDLVALRGAWSDTGELHVARGSGGGTFGPDEAYSVSPEEANLVVGDFDRDGRADVASLSWLLSMGGGLTLYMNQGDGTLAVLPRLYVPNYPGPGCVGDFDGNSTLDLAFLYFDYSPSGIAVLMNRLVPIPTPVTLSVVDAACEGGVVRVRWLAGGHAPAAVAQRRESSGDWQDLGSLLPDGTGTFTLEDRDVQPNHTYAYRLRMGSGAAETLSPEVTVVVPGLGLAIERVAPDPIAGAAEVRLALAGGERATLDLLDVNGRLVRRAGLDRPRPGSRSLVFEARGVSPGVYWLRLEQGGRTVTRRVVVLR
jgi:hypothetical protein